MTNPALVEVTRGGTVESVHRGAACVVDATGKVIHAWGDVDAMICPRSSLKPLQALALVQGGAADAVQISAEELALACASHSGEPMHTTRVAAWLTRMGLSERDLECGAHLPTNEAAAKTLICENVTPGALHNNCSGKHTGFLCCALHLGVTIKGYVAPDHPVQRRALHEIATIADIKLADTPVVIDGCSAPNIFMPLHNLALGWARLADHPRIVDAMKAHPLLMSGTGRVCAQLIPALAGRGIVKTGAEGVFAACLPEHGLGIAVKIDDGAGRAASLAIAAILNQLRAFRPDADISQLIATEVVNWRGTETGMIRPSAALT